MWIIGYWPDLARVYFADMFIASLVASSVMYFVIEKN